MNRFMLSTASEKGGNFKRTLIRVRSTVQVSPGPPTKFMIARSILLMATFITTLPNA
jgi:hypothetical protein